MKRFAGDLGCTSYRLHRAALAASRFYERHMAGSGLGMAQFALLSTMHDLHGSTVTDIAEAIGLERTTLTRNLETLKKRRLIAVAEGRDGRTRAVHLTNQGREAFQKALPFWKKAQSLMSKTLGPAFLKRLHGELEIAIEKMPE